MANLGSITYTSVVWTTGDVITEAKLDNMVANDQAYDAHSAQGLLLDNAKAYCSKDSGGTARDLMRLNSSNILELSAWDGWLKLPTENVPTYASATTITNPTGIDWTTFIKIGDKVKFTQTSAKYFYVTAVTATTLTLSAGTTYTVANAAITDFYYSKSETPQGFPHWFPYTATITAGSGTITTSSLFSARFSMIGKTVHLMKIINITTNGTGAVSIICTLPIASSNFFVMSGRENGLTGSSVHAIAGGAGMVINTYNNGYPGGSGASIHLGGFYEL